MTKRWGFDIDGVLTEFEAGFRALIARVIGVDLLSTQATPRIEPTGWINLRKAGYTQPQIDQVWDTIKTSRQFWSQLSSSEQITTFHTALSDIGHDDIYFVTARPGLAAKAQTEQWLIQHTGIVTPTVLVTREKGLVARALGLHVYIDDRLDMALDVRLESPRTRVYLLAKPYNAYDDINGITRVRSLRELFDAEVDREG